MIEYQTKKEKTVIFLSGDIDHHSSELLRKEIDEIIRKTEPEESVLDFSGVTFCDSSGIALVLGRYKLMNAAGGKVTLCSLPKSAKNIFLMAGLDRFVRIKEEV